MSVSRSVQAAQRRRAGPPEQKQSRGPGTSINSAQTFSNQSTNSSIRTNQSTKLNPAPDITKLSIAQAITLITLRLGAIERNVHQMNFESINGGETANPETTLIDKSVFESLLSRLGALEEKEDIDTIQSSNSNSDFTSLKQQIDTIKLSIVQNKNTHTKEMKSQIESLKKKIASTEESMNQSMNELRELISNMTVDTTEDDEVDEDAVEDEVEVEDVEIIETNLKAIIEEELNSNNNN
jgi:hypothetical protein